MLTASLYIIVCSARNRLRVRLRRLRVPSTSGFTRVRTGIAIWLLFTTGKVFVAGISLLRTRVAVVTTPSRGAAWAPFLVLVAALALVVGAVVRAFLARPVDNPNDA